LGFIGSLFSNDKGAGFQGSSTPTPVSGVPIAQAPIANAANPWQTQWSGDETIGGLTDQWRLNTQLAGANGVGNQSSVFNQLQGVANGTGPNPAQAMLAQSTGQNVAAQSALMAGQRGANANAGLIARQAAQQGAATQQQAAGQAATLQANQSLNALGQMGGIANQQVGNALAGTNNLTTNALAQQGMLINNQNAINSANIANAQQYNNANVGMQSNINNANVGMQSNINNVNAGIAQGNQQIQGGILSGLAGSVGSAFHLLAKGGEVTKKMADGGFPGDPTNGEMGGPRSRVAQAMFQSGQSMGSFGGKAMGSMMPSMSSSSTPITDANFSMPQMGSQFGGTMPALAKGGKVPLIGEKYAMKMKPVPGKASVKGDSLKNDKVKALLSPGEIVIPRSIAQSEDAPRRAAMFVAAVKAKHGRMK